jgi:hypothetical protein
MSGKMNWDRVRKENQSMRSGTDWIGQDKTGAEPSIKTKKKAHARAFSNKKRFRRIREATSVSTVSTPKPSLKEFTDLINRLRRQSSVKTFMTSLLHEVEHDRTVGEQGRKEADRLIRYLLNNLGSVPQAVLESDLITLMQNRTHVYLRAKDNDAARTVQLAARKLKLRLYRLRCSPLTSEGDLSGFSAQREDFRPTPLCEAFTKGGVFCFESVQKATPDFQFWLKGWLGESAAIGGSTVKRHPNFILVVTDTVPMLSLWPGHTDEACWDPLTYIDLTAPLVR